MACITELLVCFGAALVAQQPLVRDIAFEVASIKPGQDPPGSVSGIFESKAGISAKNVYAPALYSRCIRYRGVPDRGRTKVGQRGSILYPSNHSRSDGRSRLDADAANAAVRPVQAGASPRAKSPLRIPAGARQGRTEGWRLRTRRWQCWKFEQRAHRWQGLYDGPARNEAVANAARAGFGRHGGCWQVRLETGMDAGANSAYGRRWQRLRSAEHHKGWVCWAMEERVKQLRVRLEVQSEPRRGTTLPVPA